MGVLLRVDVCSRSSYASSMTGRFRVSLTASTRSVNRIMSDHPRAQVKLSKTVVKVRSAAEGRTYITAASAMFGYEEAV